MAGGAVLKRCRVCGAALSNMPVIELRNMPDSAQGFLTKAQLKRDRLRDLSIYQCNACGILQHTNRPVPYYRDVIRASAYSPEMKAFRIKQFRSFLNRFDLKDKKIIEVGCGRGEFVELMMRAGAQNVFGLEHSVSAVRQARKRGLNVFQGYPEGSEYRIKNNPFDAFYTLNFLEHAPYINEFLKNIQINLADDAVGLVEVPNFDMMVYESMISEFIRDHIFYFTKDSFRHLLECNGFEVLELEAIWYNYILSAVVRKRRRIDLSHFSTALADLTLEFNDLKDRFRGKKIVVWGAGHQALAVLSMTGIYKSIDYVVDSAEFKQGLYCPGSKLEVKGPDILLKDRPDLIIVMCGSYSDEVARIIRDMELGCAVVVLDGMRLKYIMGF